MTRLRSHLLRWLLIPLFLLSLVGFRVSYVRGLEQAHQAYDRTLLGSALAMAERITVQDGKLSVDVPYAALEMLETGFQDRIFYRVTGLDPPTAVTGYDDLPPPAKLPALGKPVFYEASYRGEPVRQVALLRPLYDPAVRGPVLIQVAETTGAREALSRKILRDSALFQLLLIGAAALLIGFGVRRGLAPLMRIRNEIRSRDRADLTPIALRDAPREVAPLIEAINAHTERQRRLNEAQRRFISDASHQLKTPLTVLKTQAARALRKSDPGEMRAIVQEIHDGTDATSRVIQQLLTLARSEPGDGIEMEPVDLAALARDSVFALLPQALEKAIDLGLEEAGPLPMTGSPLLLQELVSNLVDNAIRYTPAGGHITARVVLEGGRPLLEVEDNGPGIPAAERAKVFDRFYRVPGASAEGCGLGLPIVKEIAERHGAVVELADGAEGRGLLVRVRFPPAAERRPRPAGKPPCRHIS